MNQPEKKRERMPSEEELRRHRPEWEQWQASIAKRFDSKSVKLIERGWAAGFFDGEGHARSRGHDDLVASPEMDLSIDQKYGELGHANLQRFHRAVENAGNIVKLNRGGWRWSAASEGDIETVWAAIGPFLGLAKFIQFRRVRIVPALRQMRSEGLGLRGKKRSNIRSVTVTSRKPR